MVFSFGVGVEFQIVLFVIFCMAYRSLSLQYSLSGQGFCVVFPLGQVVARGGRSVRPRGEMLADLGGLVVRFALDEGLN